MNTINFLFYIAIAVFSHSGAVEIVADTVEEYAGLVIDCGNTEDCTVICCADQSCQDATINCPQDFNCNIRCESHYSCAGAIINYPTGADAEGSLTCTGSNSCDIMVFPTPNPNLPYNITCEGYHACQNSLLLCPTSANCNIRCQDYEACKGSTVQCPTTGDCNIECYGDDACEASGITCPENGICDIDCYGYEACYTAGITCADDQPCNIDCEGEYACEDAVITSPDDPNLIDFTCPGPYDKFWTCYGVTFPILVPDERVIFDCSGYGTCEGSTLNCPADADCTVICGYEGCKDAIINCPTGSNGGCAVLCEEQNACQNTEIDWNGNCNALICKEATATYCNGVTDVPTSATECELPFPIPTTSPTQQPSLTPTTQTTHPTPSPTNDDNDDSSSSGSSSK